MLFLPQSIAAGFALVKEKKYRSPTLIPGKLLTPLSSPALHLDLLDPVLLHLKFLMEISCLLEEVHGKMSVTYDKTYDKKCIRSPWAWGHLTEWKEQVFFLRGQVRYSV